jgi:hypothetical protein
VDQRVAEVEVDAVRLVGQLAQLRVALALGERHRVGGLPAGAGGLLLLRCRGGLASSSSWVRLIAPLTSSRYSGRSTMIGRPAPSNSISTPAARAWSTSASVNRICGGP